MVVNVKNTLPTAQGHPGFLIASSEGVGRADLLESLRKAIALWGSAPRPAAPLPRGEPPPSAAGSGGASPHVIAASIAQLRGLDLARIDIVICATRLADGSGLEALEAIRRRRPHVPVIMAGCRADAGLAIASIRAGASDFVIVDPGDATGLAVAVEKCFTQQRVRRENDRLRDELRQSLAELEIRNRQLEAVVNQLEVKARTDPLTGLANRRWLNLMLQGAWAEATRHDLPLGCLMIDLDGFKALNDRAGHQRGDDALRAAGRIIHDSCREIDVQARYGGDEFCIVMPHTEPYEAVMVAERISTAFAEVAREFSTDEAPLGLSIGVAHRHLSRPASADALITHADEALYAAKAAGKGRVVVRGAGGVFAPMTRG